MHYIKPILEVIVLTRTNIVTESLVNGGVGDGNEIYPGQGGVDAPEDDWGSNQEEIK